MSGTVAAHFTVELGQVLLAHPTFLSSVPSQSQDPAQHSPPSRQSPCSAFDT